MKLRSALVLLGMVFVMAACGDDGGPEETTTSTGSAIEAEGPASTSVPTTESVLSDLTGEWDNGILVLVVNDAGEYVLSSSDDPDAPLMGGFVARDGDQFTFVTSTTGSCPGQSGVYRVSITAEELSLSPVDDPCQERADGLVEPLARVSN